MPEATRTEPTPPKRRRARQDRTLQATLAVIQTLGPLAPDARMQVLSAAAAFYALPEPL